MGLAVELLFEAIKKRALFNTELVINDCLRRIERRVNIDGEEVTVLYINKGDEGL
jgi:hypothetical protein